MSYNKPSRTKVIIFSLVWLFGTICSILAMTDLFRESLFQGKHLMEHLLLLGSTACILFIHYQYWRKV